MWNEWFTASNKTENIIDKIKIKKTVCTRIELKSQETGYYCTHVMYTESERKIDLSTHKNRQTHTKNGSSAYNAIDADFIHWFVNRLFESVSFVFAGVETVFNVQEKTFEKFRTKLTNTTNMLSADQNHIDSEFNGGFNAIDSELMNLRPNSGQTLLNAHQLQQQQQQQQKSPAATANAKQNNIVQSNANPKKSVMLNFKSGAINSTVEEFGNFSTRFSDTFTQNGRRYRVWLVAVGIVIACLCCFVFGLSFNYLFDTQPCGGKFTFPLHILQKQKNCP